MEWSPDKLIALRKNLSLTKKAMSEKLELSPSYYNRVEAGTYSIPKRCFLVLNALSEQPLITRWSINELKKLRLRLGLSRRKMAVILGVTPATYCLWEKKGISLAGSKKVAEKLVELELTASTSTFS